MQTCSGLFVQPQTSSYLVDPTRDSMVCLATARIHPGPRVWPLQYIQYIVYFSLLPSANNPDHIVALFVSRIVGNEELRRHDDVPNWVAPMEIPSSPE